MPKTPKLPTVIIWDLDETLIGNSNNMLSLQDLYTFIDFLQRTKEIPTTMRLTQRGAHTMAMRYMEGVPDFIRPHLKEAFEALRKSLDNAEFFVYSAGLPSYVSMFVKYMEEHAGITIRRPIFSRDKTAVTNNKRYKSIQFAYESIIDALVADYPALASQDNREFVIENRVLFVDDNDFLWDHKDKWVQCPKYPYLPVIDLACLIPNEVLRQPKVNEFIAQQNAFAVESLNESLTHEEKRVMYHVALAKIYQGVMETNMQARKDDFLLRFAKAVHAVSGHRRKPFTAAKVAELKARLSLPQK